jgi:hypothetical protein
MAQEPQHTNQTFKAAKLWRAVNPSTRIQLAPRLWGALGNQSNDITSAERALIDAVLGVFGGGIDETEKRQSIVWECMKGRGHRVVG